MRQILQDKGRLRKTWTIEEIKQEAQKYRTSSEFSKGSPKAYGAYIRSGRPQEILNLLTPLKRSWSIESAKQEASKYPDRWTFQKGCGSAYRILWKKGLLEDVFGPLPEKQSWNYEKVVECANLCKHRTDFKIKYPGGHQWAYEKGLLSELFGETYNTPECDNDVLYIWSVVEIPNLYKVGITSSRLGIRRINYSCRKGSVKADKIWLFYVDDAKTLEKEILSLGESYTFDKPFSGSTEFRVFDEITLNFCLSKAGGLSKDMTLEGLNKDA
jgi:hypothetical protein